MVVDCRTQLAASTFLCSRVDLCASREGRASGSRVGDLHGVVSVQEVAGVLAQDEGTGSQRV
jgi:hypothetical protein